MADVLPLRAAPPHDLDAEAAVLSAMVLIPDKYDEVIGVVRPDMFYSEPNRLIYEAIAGIRESGGAMDIVTIGHALNETGKLARVGGSPYLAQIIDATPHVANVLDHAKIVRERWRLRQAVARAQTLIATVKAGTVADADVQALLEEHELSFGELAHQQQTKFMIALKDALSEAYLNLQAMSQRGTTISGTPTGFKRLDDAMSGLHAGDLYIVAGRPGSGKTSFAMDIGRAVSAQGEGVAVFSLEMPHQQLCLRLLAAETRISLARFRKPQSLVNQWGSVTQALASMEKYPMWIDDTGGISIFEIRARVRRLKAEIAAGRLPAGVTCTQLKLVIVDYLQLVQGSNERSREQEVSLVSRELKKLAKNEGVIVIALSQLNRSPETRSGGDKRPRLSDLRESGAIEQDADAVMFVFRPSMYSDDPELMGWAEIILGKQRNGPVGIHKVAFSQECVRFGDLADGEYDEFDDFTPMA